MTPATDPVAVVTGASRGLGRGIARRLARSGFNVVCGYHRAAAEAASLVKEIESLGRRAVAVPGDVALASTAAALAESAADLGTLTVWVNNAGVSVLAPIIDTTAADLDVMIQANLVGVFHGVRVAARTMIAAGTPGRIINIASECGIQAFPLLGAYSATKFAVVGLTQAAALELAPHGITVNAIGPGTAETDMVLAEREREVEVTGQSAETVRGDYLRNIPVGRFCDPDDVGALVAFVAGPDASYLTGQTLLPNGGSVLH